MFLTADSYTMHMTMIRTDVFLMYFSFLVNQFIIALAVWSVLSHSVQTGSISVSTVFRFISLRIIEFSDRTLSPTLRVLDDTLMSGVVISKTPHFKGHFEINHNGDNEVDTSPSSPKPVFTSLDCAVLHRLYQSKHLL